MVKFSEEVCETIYELIRKGYTNKDVCAACDIEEKTFYNWIERGKKAKSGKFKKFYMELEKCKLERKKTLKEELLEIGRRKDDWRAIAWMLERSYGDEFARPEVKIKQEFDGKLEADVNIDLTRFERNLKKLKKD